MPSAKDKQRMLDYLEFKLTSAGHKAEPRVDRYVSDRMLSSYILLDDSAGAVVLIDQPYQKNNLNNFVRHVMMSHSPQEMAFVFYKDGKTFFRSAAKKNMYKSSSKNGKALSLKKYSAEEMRKMIAFRPEEKYVYGCRNAGLQYFQPESKNLTECLVTFKFSPAEYVRSGKTKSGFILSNGPSSKIFIWDERYERDCSLRMYKNYLVPEENIRK